MSTEKRLVLFFVLALASFWGTEFLMDRLGLLPKPQPKVAQEAKEAKAEPKPAAVDRAKSADKPALAASEKPEPKGETKPKEKAEAPRAKLLESKDLTLGSLDKASGYHLAFQVDQKGAGVAWLKSGIYGAERTRRGRPKQPLSLIEEDRLAPPSFSINLLPTSHSAGEALDYRVWEVVPDERGRTVLPVLKGRDEVGQRIVLRASAGDPPVVVTRTYTLRKGEDGLDMELTFEGRDEARKVVYELLGPHGVPIEGDWYTSTFRDIFVEQAGGGGIKTEVGYNIARAKDKQERYQTYPLAFAGVENQYFAVFFAPDPSTWTPEKRIDKETVPTVIHEDKEDPQRADVSLVMTSKEFEVGPNVSRTHRFHVFAGPKMPDILPGYAAELATFRKGWSMLGLGWLGRQVAQSVITPLLGATYRVTQAVAGLFGGRNGNYGVAIILLVITVRLCLFPLSRKQAIMAKKMQDLQPHMAELREKYKDDKERQMKETFALQRKHGVNMFGGCLPALIQIPIFMGLWQALNNSVALRHAEFLWIRDLSAPDMLFPWPFDMMAMPFGIGRWIGPYFNLLPLVSACLMLVHTKLFAPPPTTPEAEMQQSMMKYMMVFMALMLYKVPSGLGIYFITSSSWAIAERLLLPKTIKIKPVVEADDEKGGRDGGDGRGPDGKGGGGWFAKKLERLLEEASKDPTIRNKIDKARERAGEADRERSAPGPKTRPRPKPGKRR